MNPRFRAQIQARTRINTHHNGRIMASRIFALIIWAAVAASLAYWGLRWMAHPTAVPSNATPVSMADGVQGDFKRLLQGPAQPNSGAAQADPSAASALASRLKLLGLFAATHGGQGGVALLSVDDKPPRAVRLGGIVDGDMRLTKLTQRSAEIGPLDGPVTVTLELPLLPPPSTGTLPPATGVSTTSGATAPTNAQTRPQPPGATQTPENIPSPAEIPPDGADASQMPQTPLVRGMAHNPLGQSDESLR